MDTRARERTKAIDVVATSLMVRSSRLLRLLTSFGARELSRTEAGLLGTLVDGPRRITDLADTEALAQPTVTKLVDGLQERGLVARQRSADDGRVVLVEISPVGRAKIEETRAQVRSLMRETVASLSNDELATLVEASSILERMIETLQARGAMT